MFSTVFPLQGMKQILRRPLDAAWQSLAGIAFVTMAMAAIHYDERIAPGVDRLSNGWSNVADFSRRLTSFTL